MSDGFGMTPSLPTPAALTHRILTAPHTARHLPRGPVARGNGRCPRPFVLMESNAGR